MELKIINEKANPLLKRKEISVEIHSEISPKRVDLKEAIAKKYSKTPEDIGIDQVKSKFGSKTFLITASVYDNKEARASTQKKKKKENKPEVKA